MSGKKRLDAIFLDIDDTLYSTSEFAQRARKNGLRAMTRLGLKIPLRKCMKELDEVINEFSSNYPHHFDKLLARLGPETYPDVNPELLIAAGIAAYHDTKNTELKPFPDVIPFLKKLKRTGLTSGIISSGLSLKQAEKIIRLGLTPYIKLDHIYISDQIGISKPNPKLYLHALKAAAVKPVFSMYVGDSTPKDIDPCNSIGMITVKIIRGGKHDKEEGITRALYTIRSLSDLWVILCDNYTFHKSPRRSCRRQ